MHARVLEAKMQEGELEVTIKHNLTWLVSNQGKRVAITATVLKDSKNMPLYFSFPKFARFFFLFFL